MNKSVQLAIRASEIRSEINGLEPGDSTLEKRRELLGSLNTVESEYRAALTTEAEAEAGAPDVHGLTVEEREFRELTTKAELRQAFRAVMNGDPLTGAEKELQEHRGLSGHNFPWDMVGPRPAPRTEDRADAVSAAPADSSPATASNPGPRVRPFRDRDLGRCNADGRDRRAELPRRHDHG